MSPSNWLNRSIEVLRGGLKRNAGPSEPCGMKHISFLDFLLLFYQEKSNKKVVQRSFGSNQSTNIEKSP